MSDELTAEQGAREYQRLKQRITHLTRAYVTQLNGRYSKHASNEFLISLLSNGVMAAVVMRPNALITNVAYEVGCNVFEYTLEYDCKAGGNGHHVAQGYSKMFNDFEDDKHQTGSDQNAA